MIGAVYVNEIPLEPSLVEAEAITATHGRRDSGDGPTAATAALVLLAMPGTPEPARSGDILRIIHETGAPLFRGRVTDRAISHNPDDEFHRARYTLTAMGTVSRLGLRPVGSEPWPAESATARATRILELAEVPYVVEGLNDPDDPPILARDVDTATALAELTALAESTAAAVVDSPDGAVIYQPLAGRANPVAPLYWRDFADDLEWSQLDPALTWDAEPPSLAQIPSPTTPPPLSIPPEAVLWEPLWRSAESWIINHARIAYGPTPEGGSQPWTELEDPESIAAHGRRYVYLSTQLATEAAAAARASRIITVRGRERWALGEVTVVLANLDPPDYARALESLCGDHITILALPQPAPAIDWTGILEGWTYTMTTEAAGRVESLVLNLSDPLHSLAVYRWADYPSLYEWQDHDALATWDDLNIAPAPSLIGAS